MRSQFQWIATEIMKTSVQYQYEFKFLKHFGFKLLGVFRKFQSLGPFFGEIKIISAQIRGTRLKSGKYLC
jgi:hypothetical protein